MASTSFVRSRPPTRSRWSARRRVIARMPGCIGRVGSGPYCPIAWRC
jgi:hypothetical protein